MQRRELFRLLGAGAALPVFDSNLLAMFQAAQPKSGYTIRTLNPHQNATLVIMTDLIIPETDTPGAKAVRVNEFIDLILTEWAHEDERQRFMDGFAEVDKLNNALFAKDFVDAAPVQQTAVLAELDQQLAVEIEAERYSPYVRRKHGGQLSGSFFRSVKYMTLYGYYTSEIGFTKELGKEIIPGAYHGCNPLISPGASKV
jgi:Gluconate 2-dehydrogenase subunit 3